MSHLSPQLEAAVRARALCRLRLSEGRWLDGELVRLERDTLVACVPGHPLRGGEDVLLAVDAPEKTVHARASVARTRVPIPDRSGDGLLLGTLTLVGPPHDASLAPLTLSLVASTGRPVSLLTAPVRWIEIMPTVLTFQVPLGFPLQFVHRGRLRFLLGVAGEGMTQAVGRVERLVPGEGSLLYVVSLEGVEDPALHLRVVAALRSALE